MSSFTVSEITVDSAVVLVCEGRLDLNAAGILEDRVAPLLARGIEPMVLDLAGVDYLSSAGVRCLLVILKKTGLAKSSLMLCGVTAGVLQVLELSGFRGILKIHPDRQSALQSSAPERQG